MSRKPNANSVLKTLPESRQTEIADYAAEHSLAATVKWLRDDGLQTNSSSLSEFLSWYGLQQQFRQDAQTTDAILEKLKTEVQGITDDQLDEVGQRTFSLLALRNKDLDGFVNIRSAKTRKELEVAKLKLRERKLEQDARKLALLERKAAAFDQAKEVVESTLTPEEQKARLKEILA